MASGFELRTLVLGDAIGLFGGLLVQFPEFCASLASSIRCESKWTEIPVISAPVPAIAAENDVGRL